MIFNYVIKYILLIIILLNLLFINSQNILFSKEIFNTFLNFNESSFSSYLGNTTGIPDIYIGATKINYSYSIKFGLIETKYFIKLNDQNNNLIKPSDLSLLYNLHLFCEIYIIESNEFIYSFPNIYENQYFLCIDYIKINEHVKFGIKIYLIKENSEDIIYNELFFFSNKLFNINYNANFENNNRFDVNYLYNHYNKHLLKINKIKYNKNSSNEHINLKTSFLQPPLCSFKRDIAQSEGRWYFNNIYEKYFCFCKGELCLNIKTFNMYQFQSCKYFFYLTIIDKNRYLYPKTHYLLSDFFNENIDSVDAYPLFLQMLQNNLNAHYLTMSQKIYNQFFLINNISYNSLPIIYGVRKINGDVLEKYIELFLRLKVVVAAEKYDAIDDLFYNIEYITYIFLGHGVTYIKSYLYKDYLSYKKYNKILLPPHYRFITLALNAGWKIEDIIQIGYPKWDNYEIYNNPISNQYDNKTERSIFLMFTWRKFKKGKHISDLYFSNIFNLLNSQKINNYLQKYNVKIYFCYHHELKEKKLLNFNTNTKFINQNEISTLLKNSSLIITDFSSILFDAIVQKKPLILFIPDGLDPNLKDLYVSEYYETILKLKSGLIYLNEIYFELKKVIRKIIYYIKNGFILEETRLNFYNEFNLKNKDNTKKFISYIKKLK